MNRQEVEKKVATAAFGESYRHEDGAPAVAACMALFDAITEREGKEAARTQALKEILSDPKLKEDSKCRDCDLPVPSSEDKAIDAWWTSGTLHSNLWLCPDCAKPKPEFPKVVKSGPVTPLIIDGKNVGIEQVQEVEWTDAEKAYHQALDLVSNRPSYWAHEDALKAAAKVIEGLKRHAKIDAECYAAVCASADKYRADRDSLRDKLAEAEKRADDSEIVWQTAEEARNKALSRAELAEHRLGIAREALDGMVALRLSHSGVGPYVPLNYVTETLKRIDGEAVAQPSASGSLAEMPDGVRFPTGAASEPASPLSLPDEVVKARRETDETVRQPLHSQYVKLDMVRSERLASDTALRAARDQAERFRKWAGYFMTRFKPDAGAVARARADRVEPCEEPK